MRWFLLRDRRHEGPYTKEQIAEGVKAGTIDPRDYLLPERATEDQSSFAYISAADVLGPEILFDLKKKANVPPSEAQAANKAGASVKIEASTNKENLISEFEDGLESTQLIRIKKERNLAEAGVGPAVLESFASKPENSFKFPWAIAGVVVVILGIAAYFAQPILNPSKQVAVSVGSTSSSPGTALRNTKQNRIPTGRVQLPSTSVRDDEPAASFGGARTEERAEPARKRRKRKAVDSESTEAGEDGESASDAESFDEEEYVEEDESSEEDVDEADI